MAEDLSDEEKALLAKHREAKKKTGRRVKVRGKHEETGAELEFDLEGDEADRVVSRYRSLFEEEPEGDSGDGKAQAKKGPYFKGKSD